MVRFDDLWVPDLVGDRFCVLLTRAVYRVPDGGQLVVDKFRSQFDGERPAAVSTGKDAADCETAEGCREVLR